jgi:hypothetical protein
MPTTEVSTIELFIRQWGGWIGLLIFFLYAKVWPLIADKWFPSLMKKSEESHRQQLKQKEAEYQARLVEIRDDIEFRRGIERERAAAAKVTSDAIQQLGVAMIQTNERIAQIMANQATILDRQNDTLSALNTAVTEMKERLARRQGYEERKRETGPLDKDKP